MSFDFKETVQGGIVTTIIALIAQKTYDIFKDIKRNKTSHNNTLKNIKEEFERLNTITEKGGYIQHPRIEKNVNECQALLKIHKDILTSEIIENGNKYCADIWTTSTHMNNFDKTRLARLRNQYQQITEGINSLIK